MGSFSGFEGRRLISGCANRCTTEGGDGRNEVKAGECVEGRGAEVRDREEGERGV